MATLRIEINDSRFVAHNGVNVETFSHNHVVGNGWECTLDERGNVSCIATQFYLGKRHQIKFNLKNGWVKLLLKINDEYPKALKSYKLNEWPVDGVIGLPDGYIDSRRAYFREANFQKFLEEKGISSVRCKNANGIYILMHEVIGEGTVLEEKIETDGNYKFILNRVKTIEDSSENHFEVYQEVEVNDATWVIKTVMNRYTKLKILYTREDPKKIVGLPKL